MEIVWLIWIVIIACREYISIDTLIIFFGLMAISMRIGELTRKARKNI